MMMVDETGKENDDTLANPIAAETSGLSADANVYSASSGAASSSVSVTQADAIVRKQLERDTRNDIKDALASGLAKLGRAGHLAIDEIESLAADVEAAIAKRV